VGSSPLRLQSLLLALQEVPLRKPCVLSRTAGSLGDLLATSADVS
jgi:hypothetical protein